MMALVERFVVAVERIAAAMESRAASIATAAEVLEEHREAVAAVQGPEGPVADEPEDFSVAVEPEELQKAAEPEDFPVATGPAANGQDLVDRERVKKELEALGVEVPPRTRVSTMLKMMEDARAKGSNAPDREDAPEDMAPEKMCDRIREGLKAVALRHGRDAAIELLANSGEGACNISSLDPGHYWRVLGAISEKLEEQK
jgi:hypothetical protein